jgi:dUTP pyrophosphatase
MTKIQIKKLSNEVLTPKYETSGSSGMDIAAYIERDIIINPGEKALIPTGFSLSVPRGYEVQIRPRSGLAVKKGVTVLNTPGTIDSDYRGEIKVILINLSKDEFSVKNGERIAQMVVCPIKQVIVERLKN